MDYPEDEDYEIISKKDIAALRGEVKQIKEGGAPSENTVLSRLNQMLELFKEASTSMGEENPSYEKLDEINEKLDKILEQHKQLADGILAIADMIKAASGEETEKLEQPKPMPAQMPAFNAPPTQPQSQMPPPPMFGPMPRQESITMPFPKPEMPSFGPLEEPSNEAGLPPLPPKLGKSRMLGF